jgi:hypothetical protein
MSMDSSSSNSCSTTRSLAEEVTELRQQFPKVHIQSATHDFLTAGYQRTRYAHIKATLTFCQNYPTKPCIVSVQQDHQYIPKGLARKLETDLGNVAERFKGTHQQVVAVFQHLVTFVDTNLFIPCWKELRQVFDLQRPIKVDETKGYMKIRFVGGEYYYSCSITIDKGYPSTQSHIDYGKPCQLTMDTTNLPQQIERLLTVQARNLVKRMQDGMSANHALHYSNPIQGPADPHNNNGEGAARQVSSVVLKSLKHDVETLAHIRDLKNVDKTTKRGTNPKANNAAHVRKEARREIHKISSSEKKSDEQLEQWQLEEQNRLQAHDIPEYDGSLPQPSLLSLVTFLHNMMDQLPQKTCPCCSKTVLLPNPKDLSALFAKKPENMTHAQLQKRKQARKLRPIRTSCGCWYHYTCLDTYMTAPPFGASCPSCERRVFHPDWSGNMAELERAWAQTQARQREIQDAAMLF